MDVGVVDTKTQNAIVDLQALFRGCFARKVIRANQFKSSIEGSSVVNVLLSAYTTVAQ